jgi:hypothetical protein
MTGWMARFRCFVAPVGEAWRESAGAGLRCEEHPDRAFGHDACAGAGLFRHDAIDHAVGLQRLERQRAAELDRLRAEAVVFYQDALRQAAAAAAFAAPGGTPKSRRARSAPPASGDAGALRLVGRLVERLRRDFLISRQA